jgi:hypothetical protein
MEAEFFFRSSGNHLQVYTMPQPRRLLYKYICKVATVVRRKRNTKLRHFWETNRFSASQEILSIL